MAKGITVDTEDIIIGITAEIVKATKIFTKNIKHFGNFDIICEEIPAAVAPTPVLSPKKPTKSKK